MIEGKMISRDNFIQENSPKIGDLPDLINLEKFCIPEQFNCVTEVLDNAIKEGYGEKTAIITPERSWTYRQLLHKSNQIANYLVEDIGVIPGNRVLLYSPNNAMMVCCWLAIVKAGGIVVAAMPTLEPEGIVKIIHKTKVEIALCDERFEERLRSVQSMTSMLRILTLFNSPFTLDSNFHKQPTTFKNQTMAADDCCIIGFTSGTTGEPKAAINLHRDIIIACEAAGKDIFQCKENDIFMGTPSIAFGFGLGALLLCPLYSRATSVLLENPSPLELLSSIEKYKASLLFTLPATYEIMQDASVNYDLSSLRLCVSGGVHLSPHLWKSWKEKTGFSLFYGIGSTEMLFLFLGPTLDDMKPGRIGKPILGYEAIVLDPNGNELPHNQVGQLAVRGPIGCRYLSSDERQKNYVINGWNVTDDCVLKDEDGYFWAHGRTENYMTSGANQISLLELEEAISNHEEVSECAVIAMPREESDYIIMAYVILKNIIGINTVNLTVILEEHMNSILSNENIQGTIEFVDSLPSTPSGKLQRYKLHKLAESLVD